MCVYAQFLSCVWLFLTHGARQAPLSMGFFRQEYWSGLPFPPLVDLPNSGVKPVCPASPALLGGIFTTEPHNLDIGPYKYHRHPIFTLDFLHPVLFVVVVILFCCLVTKSRPTLFRVCGLQPSRLLCPCDFPGESGGVGCHFLLQGVFLTQGSNPCLLHCRWILSFWATRKFVLTS